MSRVVGAGVVKEEFKKTFSIAHTAVDESFMQLRYLILFAVSKKVSAQAFKFVVKFEIPPQTLAAWIRARGPHAKSLPGFSDLHSSS
jgi:hypothetical protein